MDNPKDRNPDEQEENNAGDAQQINMVNLVFDFENTAIGQVLRQTRENLTDFETHPPLNIAPLILPPMPPLVLPPIVNVAARILSTDDERQRIEERLRAMSHLKLPPYQTAPREFSSFFPRENNAQNSNNEPHSADGEKKSPSMRKSGSSE